MRTRERTGNSQSHLRLTVDAVAHVAQRNGIRLLVSRLGEEPLRVGGGGHGEGVLFDKEGKGGRENGSWLKVKSRLRAEKWRSRDASNGEGIIFER